MFEYQILPADGFVSVAVLNGLGQDGWELVSIMPDDDGNGYEYIFKRFIRPTASMIPGRQIQHTGISGTSPIQSGAPTRQAIIPPTPQQVMDAFANANQI